MKRSLLPLTALRAVESAARNGSFKAAAKELGVTPSAVSQQIHGIEEMLGSTLFIRSARGMRKSASLSRAWGALDGGFRRLEAAMTILEDAAHPGELRLSVPPAFASKWLVPRLGGFQGMHSSIVVRISSTMELVDFDSDGFDLAIRYGSGHYPGLHVQALLQERVIPVCSLGLLGDKTARMRPADLKDCVLIHDDSAIEDESCPDWIMWLKAAGVKKASGLRAIHFDRSDLAIEAAIAGRGVALAKETIAAADLKEGRLIRPVEVSHPVEFAYYIVAPEGNLSRPAVRYFVDWLQSEAGLVRHL